MATTGDAHISNTYHSSPSIFDVVAQTSFSSSLQHAFFHITKILAEHYPSKYSWCFQYKYELFVVLKLAMEQHYLSSYGSTFSENFYDMKRVPLHSSNSSVMSSSLPPALHAKSLLASVFTSYFVARLDDRYKSRRLESQTSSSKLEGLFVKIWPLVNFIGELVTLVYYIRYLTGKSKTFSPLLHLCGITLAYLNKQDIKLREETSNRIALSNVRSVWQLSQWLTNTFGKGMKNSFEMAAFFLQFLDWFYSSSSTAPKIFSSSPIPPPPTMKYGDQNGNLKENNCPLCNKDVQQPTVLTISGIVFCYKCILVYVRRNAKCPITNYPSSTQQLVKLYKTH